MTSDSDIVSDFTQDYNRAYMLLNTYYAEAYRDVGFYLGNQLSLEQLQYLNSEQRNAFTFNKCRKTINMVSGYLSANQMQAYVTARENANPETAEQLSDLLHTQMAPHGYRAANQAKHKSLIAGLSWVFPWVDYRQDYLDGKISYRVGNWNDVVWDPFSENIDLSDSTFVARRKYLSKDVIKSLVPGREREIDALGFGNRDEKFSYEPYARQWGLQELLAYNEYWKRRYRKGQILIDKVTGEQRPWKGDARRLELMKVMFPNVAVIEGYYPSVQYNIIVENRLLHSEWEPLEDYPCVPYYCVFDSSYDLFQWKIQGLQRLLNDSQNEYNMRKSKLLDIVDSQIGSGFIAKHKSVSNPKSLFQSGQGRVIFLNDNAEMGDVQRLDPPSIPESLFMLQESFDNDIKDFVDISALGQDQTDRMSAMLYKMKTSMAIMQLGPIMDNFKEADYLLSKKVLKMIQNFSPEKVQRLIKQEPTPEFYNKAYLDYDIDFAEMPMTDYQKQSAFMQAWTMRAGGMDVPDEVLWDLSPYPINKKGRELIKQRAEAAQAAQQQDMEDRQQINELLQAKTFNDTAQGQAKLDKIKYDAALSEERLAVAQEERSRSVLNDIRAIKEMSEMDMNNARSLLDMVKIIEDHNKEESADTVIKQPAMNNSGASNE